MHRTITTFLIAAAAAAMPVTASASVQVTEFMYQGLGGDNREFFELTNLGNSAVDVTGWTYQDGVPSHDLMPIGDFFHSIVAHESVIVTEMDPTAFNDYWQLGGTVRIYSIGNNDNLGKSDTINIFDQNGVTIDSIAYDKSNGGSTVTTGISGNLPLGTAPMSSGDAFILSAVGDGFGSHYASTAGTTDLGNPGFYPFGAVPEPASWTLMIAGFGLAGATLRKRSAVRFA